MMDGARGLSAGARFALARQLAARCVVLMAYVLVGYGVPWLWGLVLGLASGGYYVVEYHVLGPTLAMGAVVAAVLAASGFRSLISMGVGRGVYCWTQMLANLCFAFACSAVVTFGFTLTPNRDADILITFRVGRDLQWLACTPPSDAFGRLRFLNRDLGGSYAAMRTGVRGDTANPMLLFLAVFLLVASAVILGQCVGELLARVNLYGTIALVASACVAWAARPWLMNRSATDVNPVIWKLLEALHGRWCLMWREGQAAPAAMYGTSNERLVYDQAYTFWPMMVLFVGVMIFGNLLCWLLIRRREVRVPQLLPVWW